MHALFNAIKDMTKSVRPSFSGDKHLYENENRTYSASVKAACLEAGLHQHFQHAGPPPWVFTKQECIAADGYRTRVLGVKGCTELPDGVMKRGKWTGLVIICRFLSNPVESRRLPISVESCRILLNLVVSLFLSNPVVSRRISSFTYFFRILTNCVHYYALGKGRNTHSTIYWASTFARWCFKGKGSPIYNANILELFDLFTLLNASSINIQVLETVIIPRLIDCLITRSGLVPPVECTLALHDVLHVAQQIREVGMPRYSTLFKFERMNLFLKRLCRNKAAGLASIVKNYAEGEQLVMGMGLDFKNIKRMYSMNKYTPPGASTPLKDISHCLKAIHVDYDGNVPTIYDIPNCNMMELRGQATAEHMTTANFNILLMDVVDNIDQNSTLFWLHGRYLRYCVGHPRRFHRNFMGYLTFVFHSTPAERAELLEEHRNYMDEENYDNDSRQIHEADMQEVSMTAGLDTFPVK